MRHGALTALTAALALVVPASALARIPTIQNVRVVNNTESFNSGETTRTVGPEGCSPEAEPEVCHLEHAEVWEQCQEDQVETEEHEVISSYENTANTDHFHERVHGRIQEQPSENILAGVHSGRVQIFRWEDEEVEILPPQIFGIEPGVFTTVAEVEAGHFVANYSFFWAAGPYAGSEGHTNYVLVPIGERPGHTGCSA
jgi:hypothetical protein